MTTIRTATAADHPALDHLAQLDSSQIPPTPAIVAEVDGRLIAALSLSDGAVVADPFMRTAGTVELLRRRARELGTAPRRRHRLATLRLA